MRLAMETDTFSPPKLLASFSAVWMMYITSDGKEILRCVTYHGNVITLYFLAALRDSRMAHFNGTINFRFQQ